MKETTLTRTDEVGSGPYDSIAWAYEVHLKKTDTREYHFAILYGNEDAPKKIEFFSAPEPLWDEAPNFTWEPREDES